MIDLKPYFDAARTADDEVQRVMNEMHTAFNEGTEDGKQKALDLRPSLDEVQQKADEANKLYISMRNAANVSSDAAKNFVPVPETNQEEIEKIALKRADFLALDAAARMKFIQGGGKVTE